MKRIIFLWVLLFSGPLFAQTEAPTEAPPAEAQPAEAAEAPSFITINVKVTHATGERAVPNVPVFLQAARARGPFEPTPPTPQFEWESFTNADGIAVFNRIPAELTTSGLKVHALTTFEGVPFESAASTPADGVTLQANVWDSSLDTSGVAIKNLRTVVDVWEGYLVFTQFYTLTNTAHTVLDVKQLPEEIAERGLPFELPLKAQGINVVGSGQSTVINSTFYWKGVLQPGASINLQVRFSMSAKSAEFVYEQQVDYPTENVEVVVPIQTRYQKLPRLEHLELRPLGFEHTDRGPGIFDLRADMDFVGARGLTLKPGESFSFQLRGLPFASSKMPWLFLLLGVVCASVIVALSLRVQRTVNDKAELRRVFEAQRADLLDALIAIEKDLEQGVITRSEAELESTALREQLALVLKKLEDLNAA